MRQKQGNCGSFSVTISLEKEREEKKKRDSLMERTYSLCGYYFSFNMGGKKKEDLRAVAEARAIERGECIQ